MVAFVEGFLCILITQYCMIRARNLHRFNTASDDDKTETCPASEGQGFLKVWFILSPICLRNPQECQEILVII